MAGKKLRMPSATIEKVRGRAGDRCEMCGTSESLRWSFHHRIPRGMGGSRDPSLNDPANILLLCGSGTEGCHGYVESNRAEAYGKGLLLHRDDEITESPVSLVHGRVMLNDEGGMDLC